MTSIRIGGKPAPRGRLTQEDPEYKTLMRVLRGMQSRINIQKESNEILTLHESRKSLGLMSSSKRYNPQYVYDCVLTDMAYRGRLVTMIKRVNNTVTLLERAEKAFRAYALTSFRAQLGSTQGERANALDRICRPVLDFKSECQDHVAGIEVVIKDIDQAGFSYARLVSLLEMFNERKGPRNV